MAMSGSKEGLVQVSVRKAMSGECDVIPEFYGMFVKGAGVEEQAVEEVVVDGVGVVHEGVVSGCGLVVGWCAAGLVGGGGGRAGVYCVGGVVFVVGGSLWLVCGVREEEQEK
ncbi:hypothetical protein NDU88_002219 [Pleurodeles waltl]|uniref:Uncharacterized protein n=1 Tax=Pleurodeles waltl TaxID=8319 RepID=A0AAV7T1Y2_PLEWA|nr:hypothetical protein NDU88_002219 [Pleurodeles waltl]